MLRFESYLTGSKSNFHCVTNYTLMYLHTCISLCKQCVDYQLKVKSSVYNTYNRKTQITIVLKNVYFSLT